jgi:hypothetical protein
MRIISILGVKGSKTTESVKGNVQEAVIKLGIPATIEQVSELDVFLQHRISGIPAVLVDGRIVFERQVPAVEEIMRVLSSTT